MCRPMCGVRQENGTGLNAWPLQWGDPGVCRRGRESVTANQSTVVLSDHLHPNMKRLNPDGNGPYQGDDRVAGGQWMDRWTWKCCESYAVTFAVSRSQPGWTPLADFGPTCWMAFSTTVIKTPNYGVHPIPHRFGESRPRSTEAVLTALGGPTPY